MGGIAVTTGRASEMVFSPPYVDETLSFVVPDHRRADFSSAEWIRNASGLRIAVPNLPYLEEIVQREFPRVEIVPISVDRVADFFAGRMEHVDGLVFPAERGSTSPYSTRPFRSQCRTRWRFISPCLPGGASRLGVRAVSRHLDRPAAKERHRPGALRPLDSGARCAAQAAALVGDSRCAALGELSSRLLKKLICFVALDRFRVNVQKSTPSAHRSSRALPLSSLSSLHGNPETTRHFGAKTPRTPGS